MNLDLIVKGSVCYLTNLSFQRLPMMRTELCSGPHTVTAGLYHAQSSTEIISVSTLTYAGTSASKLEAQAAGSFVL